MVKKSLFITTIALIAVGLIFAIGASGSLELQKITIKQALNVYIIGFAFLAIGFIVGKFTDKI